MKDLFWNRKLFFVVLVLVVASSILSGCVPGGEDGDSCVDNEGGRYYDVKGSISFNGATQDDTCENADYVNEVYCNGDSFAKEQYRCSAGCEDGACITGSVGAQATCSTSQEFCDGVDNDCDGMIDEGCA